MPMSTGYLSPSEPRSSHIIFAEAARIAPKFDRTIAKRYSQIGLALFSPYARSRGRTYGFSGH